MMENKLKLLFVDDDADDRNFFVEAVKEINPAIECAVAKDGLYALEMLTNESLPLPDFIFLDLRMPRYNGKRSLLEIKNNKRLSGIPVIIYTTSIDVKESNELKDLGAAHFISKPRSTEDIYYLLSVVLEEQMALLGKKI